MTRLLWLASMLIALLGSAGCGEEPSPLGPQSAAPDAVEEIDWDRLIPADWRPEALLEELDLDTLDTVDDDDPRAVALMDKLNRLWADAPVVEELDGHRVRLPGFVVPLEMDARRMAEFLLVPYYGACIHVPPPPANQTVHVVAPEGREYVGEMFDVVWVTGTLRVVASSSDLAQAGYRIDVTEIEPYLGDVEPL